MSRDFAQIPQFFTKLTYNVLRFWHFSPKTLLKKYFNVGKAPCYGDKVYVNLHTILDRWERNGYNS